MKPPKSQARPPDSVLVGAVSNRTYTTTLVGAISRSRPARAAKIRDYTETEFFLENSVSDTRLINVYCALSEIASFVGSNEWIASAIEIPAIS